MLSMWTSLWSKNLWVAYWTVNLAYHVGWWTTIFHPPTPAQATMLVSFRGSLHPHPILVTLVTYHGFCGIFLLTKHRFLWRIRVFLAPKIAPSLINCALDQRQMGREFVLSLQPGTLLAGLIELEVLHNACFRYHSFVICLAGFWRWIFWNMCCHPLLSSWVLQCLDFDPK